MTNRLSELTERLKQVSIERHGIEQDFGARIAEFDKEELLVLRALAEHVESHGLGPKPAPKKRTKKKPPEPDHDKIAKQYANFNPTEGGCLCGCAQDVPEGTNFVRNHDKKLKSIALAVKAGALDSDKLSHAGNQYALTQKWIGDD